MNPELLKSRDTTFDLSAIRGVKARKTGKDQYRNRRLSDSDIQKIKACYNANNGRHGVMAAIGRKVGMSASSIWWIIDGRSYK